MNQSQGAGRGVGKDRKSILTKKIRIHIFEVIFCNPEKFECTNLSLSGYQCFEKMFTLVNEELKKIEIHK
jgi:hypothetical protein